MSRKITINNLAHTPAETIVKEDTDDVVEINILDEELILWDNDTIFNKLPNEQGVYVIYDYKDDPVYVGKTWNTKGFNERFKNHRTNEAGYFPYWQLVAKHVRLYHIKKRLEMLTLERIKIQQHEPPFNKEDLDKGYEVANGEKESIRERLTILVEKIREYEINSRFTDFDIRLFVVLGGFYIAQEMMALESTQPGALNEWFEDLEEEKKKLPSYSKGYVAGMRELVYGDPF
jgi:hypothetical protein